MKIQIQYLQICVADFAEIFLNLYEAFGLTLAVQQRVILNLLKWPALLSRTYDGRLGLLLWFLEEVAQEGRNVLFDCLFFKNQLKTCFFREKNNNLLFWSE